ncbi:unnamed protein product [Closterium sp. Yama58-4]|nr:unnamed protein product [Closterium sp. Yama58-4]
MINLLSATSISLGTGVIGDPVLVWSDESLSKTDNDSQEEPVINDEPPPFICIIREIRQRVRAGALAPVEVVGQWMYSVHEISDDRRKFHGFSRSSCSLLPYNEQELADRRLLFYSFHTDPFDAEAIAGKCTIHMLPRAKGFPKEEEAGGFVVHFVYRHLDGRIVAVDDRKAVRKSNPGRVKDDSRHFKRLRKMKQRVVSDEEEQQGVQEMQESEEDIGGGELDEDNSKDRNTYGVYPGDPGDYLWNRRSRGERLDEGGGADAATTKQQSRDSVEQVRGEARTAVAEGGAVKRSASFKRGGEERGGKEDGRSGAVALAAEILERAGCCTGIPKRDHMLELLLSALLSATSSSPCASPRASAAASMPANASFTAAAVGGSSAAAAVPTVSSSAAAIPTVDSSAAAAVLTDSPSGAAPDSCAREKQRNWEMKAARAVAELEELANEKLGDGVGSRYTVKLRSVRANFKSGNCLSRRFVLRELSPSDVLSMSPEELKVIALFVSLPPASICFFRRLKSTLLPSVVLSMSPEELKAGEDSGYPQQPQGPAVQGAVYAGHGVWAGAADWEGVNAGQGKRVNAGQREEIRGIRDSRPRRRFTDQPPGQQQVHCEATGLHTEWSTAVLTGKGEAQLMPAVGWHRSTSVVNCTEAHARPANHSAPIVKPVMRIPGSAGVYAAGGEAYADTNIWSVAAVPVTATAPASAVTPTAATTAAAAAAATAASPRNSTFESTQKSSAGRPTHCAASERDGGYMMSPGKAAPGVAAGGVFTPAAAANLIDLTERDDAFTLPKSPGFSPDVRDPPPALKPASPLVSPLASASHAVRPSSPVVINLDDIDDIDSSQE